MWYGMYTAGDVDVVSSRSRPWFWFRSLAPHGTISSALLTSKMVRPAWAHQERDDFTLKGCPCPPVSLKPNGYGHMAFIHINGPHAVCTCHPPTSLCQAWKQDGGRWENKIARDTAGKRGPSSPIGACAIGQPKVIVEACVVDQACALHEARVIGHLPDMPPTAKVAGVSMGTCHPCGDEW